MDASLKYLSLTSFFLALALAGSALQPLPALALSSQELLAGLNETRQRKALPKHLYEPRLTQAAGHIAKTLARKNLNVNLRQLMLSEVRASRYPTREVGVIHGGNARNIREILQNLRGRNTGEFLLNGRQGQEIGIAYLSGTNGRLPRGVENIWVILYAKHDGMADRNWRAGIVKYVNKFRRQYGLPALRLNEKLNRAAQFHSDDMAVKDYFEHISPRGKGPGDRAKAFNYRFEMVLENLAGGDRDPEQTVEQWKASRQGHREAMLDTRVTEIGVGYRYMPNDRGRTRLTHYWAITMGQPRS